MAEGRQPPTRTFSWSLDNMPVNMPTINAQARLPGNIGNVLRELVPGLEGRPSSTPNPYLQAQAQRAADMSNEAPATSFVINIGQDGQVQRDGILNVEQSVHSAEPQLIGGGQQEGGHSPEPNNTAAEDGGQEGQHGHTHDTDNRMDWRQGKKWLERSLIFILLMLLKVTYNHRLGLLVFVGLFGTYYHANTTVKKHIAQQRDHHNSARSLLLLSWIVIFLCGNIALVYYVFEDQKLWLALILNLPKVGRIDFWTLLWVVAITDYIVKFASITLKALIAMLPRTFIPYKRRGKYYMFIEEVSQCYRCVTPIVPWVYFLKDTEHGGEWFSISLLIVYFIAKANLVWQKSKDLYKAWKKVCTDVNYGISPSREEMSVAGGACPICQDDYRDPVMLACKHIFCEDCVSMWFDRERTCPMCRANIVDNPLWRDGTTVASIIFW
ncbi:RING finger and transmembrane domain-containing protein 2-like [Lingula anatina]|uniref:RING finger and transmembrane domain-containing protein 2-like n=1 Tax=Lingula anatina TaxID=7574 RepID=A0A1S3HQP0_LINAN|nr:RING finger and transmembrane domain-containing protein 2-like [Lingula anatina]XP_013387856.1 RING finger and transmembrane domain-containing protein 2-like [Lingula anatina]|eukprot:XP_013387855.1 RING finger and transmembrane domain-containing protein 2-like [Lingula anatina]